MKASQNPRQAWLFPASRAARLESKERGALLPWEKIALALRPYPGLSYADIGAGPGVFTKKLLGITRGQGRFWAVEGQESMMRVLESRKRAWVREGLPGAARVELVLAKGSQIPLPAHSVHRALLIHLLHEIPDINAYLLDLRRVLSAGGRALIIDWATPQDSAWVGQAGPPKFSRVSASEAAGAALRAGFHSTERIWGFPHGWGLVLRLDG